MPFSSLGLPKYLIKAFNDFKFEEPTPIQAQAIPEVLTGRDVMGIAQTGSGKTASYVLPLLMKLENKKVSSEHHICSLILVPTRELAVQVEGVVKQFANYMPYKCRSMAVYGGHSLEDQLRNLHDISILVATPGRLLDLLIEKDVYANEINTLVLDEADKMLNLGFKKEMAEIMKFLPEKRQNLLFSATLSPKLEHIQKDLLNDPVVIEIAKKEDDIEFINQIAYSVLPEEKGPLLRQLINQKQMQQVLVFTSSVKQADVVERKLIQNKINAKAIHSKKKQRDRNDALKRFKEGKVRVLVSTDLLSRGIDIQFLPFVVNYELPRSPKDYIHRIGRTGRAENPGEAISFITEADEHHFKVIQKKMKKTVDIVPYEAVKAILSE